MRGRRGRSLRRLACAVVLACVRSVRACVRGVGVRAFVRLPPARVVCCVGVSCLRALRLLPALVGVGGLFFGWGGLFACACLPPCLVWVCLGGWLAGLFGWSAWGVLVLCR